MVLVKCEMCEEFKDLSKWEDGMCFICLKCAKVLQRIKKKEIEFGYTFTARSRMRIFDTLRFKEVK